MKGAEVREYYIFKSNVGVGVIDGRASLKLI